MKTLYTSVAAVVVMAVVSGSAFATEPVKEKPAFGSTLKHSNITNDSENNHAQTTASGKRSVALTGSVSVRNSNLEHSNITNTSKNNHAQTTASGEYSDAATGSVDIR